MNIAAKAFFLLARGYEQDKLSSMEDGEVERLYAEEHTTPEDKEDTGDYGLPSNPCTFCNELSCDGSCEDEDLEGPYPCYACDDKHEDGIHACGK